MTEEESKEFPKVIEWYENTCKGKFSAIKFNYLIMMMKDPFVHYHAIPRYDKEIEMFGRVWNDTNTLKGFSIVESLEEDKLQEIKNYMKERD